jgi:tRNA pseudouridine13 synthase
VEKRNLNSMDVARELAARCSVPLQQVGYAGLKDKYAVTRQWFSVPYSGDEWPAGSADEQDAGADSPRLRCLRVERHTRKLRRGQHDANHFVLTLRLAHASDADRVQALDDWFPNYFGPQRVSPTNVAAAREWLAAAPRKPRGRKQGRSGGAGGKRGWHLSVLRSELFNAVLDLRVEQGNYHTPIDGDVLLEGIPTGPLWGRGRSAAAAQAEAIEQEALQPHREVCDALEFTGLQQARRPLAQRPTEFQCRPIAASSGTEVETSTEIETSTQVETSTVVEVSFMLPPGAYATALLAHGFTLRDDSKHP